MINKHYEGQRFATREFGYKADRQITIRLSQNDLEFLRQLFPAKRNISYAIRSLIHEKRGTKPHE